MLEYKGQYTTAKVMIDEIDQATVSQIYEFINHEAFSQPVAIMPDCHKGMGAVIGFTMEMTDKIIPNVVGVDIGCGMLSENVGSNFLSIISREKLDQKIRERIPFGTNVHTRCQFAYDNEHNPFWERVNYDLLSFNREYNKRYGSIFKFVEVNKKWLRDKCEEVEMDFNRAVNSFGTLGGGNHFIEIGKSEKTGDYWITVHSGSRQFGLKIAKYWQRKAGKGQLAYLQDENMYGYLVDMLVAQKIADENREIMQQLIYHITDYPVKETVSSVHNFIDFKDFIIRKGAIRSYSGEKMIIPFNMEDGILICEGKSNPDWNFSAPHGAGRVMSRTEAKAKLSTSDAKHRMEQKKIYCSKLPVDELKGAYKDPQLIEDAIGPTATIVDRLIPVLSMKE